MKIIQPKANEVLINSKINEVESIIYQLENNQTRPCFNCHKACSCCGSFTCNCDCSSQCNELPNALSSQQDKYPIEPNVLALVYTLSSINLCQPCWSCEGHLDQSNNLQKIPQVWFYTNSLILIRLLDNCLNHFQFKKWLNYTWQISVTFSDRSCADSAFSIKPDLNLIEKADLKLLQNDISKISDELINTLKNQCDKYLKDLKGSLLQINIAQ